jgi:hypothetical protein
MSEKGLLRPDYTEQQTGPDLAGLLNMRDSRKL